VQAGVDHQLLVEAWHDEDEEQVVGADGWARLSGAEAVALVPGQGDRPIDQEGEDGKKRNDRGEVQHGTHRFRPSAPEEQR